MKRSLFASFVVVSALTACSKKEAPKEGAATAAASAPAASASGPTTTTASQPAAGGKSAALAHLPGKCDAVMRIDLAGILGVPAFKSKVVPALEEMKKGEPKDEKAKEAKAFLADAGIDPLTDVKEIAVCLRDLNAANPADQKITLVIAGTFKPGAVVPALEKNAKSGKYTVEELDGTKVIVDGSKTMFLAQASDGAIVMSYSKESLTDSLKTSDAAAAFNVPVDASIAVVMPGEFLKTAMAGKGSPFAAQADKTQRAVLALNLGKPDLELRVGMTDDKSATELAGAAKMIFGQMMQGEAPQGDPMAPVMAVLKTATIDSKGTDAVLSVAIPAGKLDELATMMVESIKNGGPAAGGALAQ